MAIWQLKTQVVPTDFMNGRSTLEEEEWQEMTWWSGCKQTEAVCERFRTLLPPLKSWHEDLQQWGEQSSNLVAIWYEKGQLESIEVRFDCRNISAVFVSKVLDIVNSIDCVLVYSRGRMVLPTTSPALLEFIDSSPNMQVLIDPGKWLPRLAMEVEQEGESL